VIWVVFLRWLASDGAEPLTTILEKSIVALAELSEHASRATGTPLEAGVAATARVAGRRT
jgi:hypothetical protein